MKIIKPLTFNPFTFSRATDATYLVASGFIETATVDELRLGYQYDIDTDSLISVGAIIEAESENRIRRSAEFENVLWVKTGAPTITDDAATSPQAGNGALFNGSVNTQFISQSLGSGWFPTSVQFSIWLKSSTTSGTVLLSAGTTTALFRIGTSNWGTDDAHAAITPYPDGWFRCEMYAVVSGSASVKIQWQDVDFYMFGAQCEYDAVGSVSASRPASSYIPTEGSTVVRAADIVVSQTPSLISSNIAEDDAPLWDDGDSYVPDNEVIVLGEYHRKYLSISTNTDKFPPDFLGVHWIDVGATNRWRMYDMNVGADLQSFATASGGDIDHLMGVETPVTSVVMLNVEGDLARVTMRNTLDNSIIYEREIDLLGTPMEVGPWEFFFDYRESISKVVLTDLPKIAPATIRVEIEGALSKIGKLIIGEHINIGCTRPGASVGIQSFSRKERDEFGNFFILQRRYIGKADFTVQLTSDMVDAVYNILAELIDIPAVYIGSEQYLSTVIYGFPRDFSIVIPGPHYSQCSLSVEGI